MGGRGSSSRLVQAKRNLAGMNHTGGGSGIDPISHKGKFKVSRLESNISGHQYEIGAIYSKKGKSEIVTTDKIRNEVSFGHVKGTLANKTLTHNHPSHSGLSSQDIKMGTANNLKQVRAVGRNPKTGATVHHIITRSGGSWKTADAKKIGKSYNKAYTSEYVKTGSHHKAVIAANKAAARTVGGKYRTREIKDTWTSAKQKKRLKKVWKTPAQGVRL